MVKSIGKAKCENGHVWWTEIVETEKPETLTIEFASCPECRGQFVEVSTRKEKKA